MKNVFSILIVLTTLLSCGRQPTATDNSLIYAKHNDPELEQAKKDAINSLDYFIKSFNEHPNDTILQYSLKTDFVENGQHEHMWISLIEIDKDQFKGYLGNDPQIVKNVKYGDMVTIARDQIEDWAILDTKTDSVEGGYSVKVFEKREQK